MADIAAPGSVYAEMLDACRAKVPPPTAELTTGGEAAVEALRQQCKAAREAMVQQSGQDDGSGGGGGGGDEMLDATCHLAVCLGREKQAANIFGGYLRSRAKGVADRALKRLSAQRALYRLSQVRCIQACTEADAEDAHPHVTAVAAVLGTAAAQLARLRGAGLTAAAAAAGGGGGAAAAAAGGTAGGQASAAAAAAAQLHGEACAAATSALTWFEADAGLARWLERAQTAVQANMQQQQQQAAATTARPPPRSPARPPPAPPLDPKTMDFLIDELAFACQLGQRYLDFAAQEGVSCCEGGPNPSARASPPRAARSPRKGGDEEGEGGEGGLLSRVQALVGAYVQLEDAYCLLSVHKALRIAEPIEVTAGVFVSSARPPSSHDRASDFSAALARALEEAVEVSEADAALPPPPPPSAAAAAAAEYDRLVAGVLRPRGGAAAAAAAEERARDLVVMANSAHFAAHSAAAVRAAIAGRLREGAPLVVALMEQVAAAQVCVLREGAPLVVAPMEQVAAAQRAYEQLRDEHLACLLREAAYPPLAEVLRRGACARACYDIDADGYEAAVAAGAPAAAALATAADEGPLGAACRAGLDSGVFALLAQAAAARLCADVEAAVLGGGGGGGVTEWGALLLQREVRVLQQRLGALVEGGTLTAQFSRLQQVVQLLTLERPADAPLLHKVGATLPTDVARAVLRLRQDFDPAAIELALGKLA
ncbi:hypothetical protein JKP88DRAFT_262701 [Tribonema minus]|uniref:Uncharacterized protein n=1 Tax=Tribonema minus TaxID=303371 RepID=A0A836CHF9_9STRA|nr:hypothetical protein JKP88DRAFT_262701 [Tribonema minus]